MPPSRQKVLTLLSALGVVRHVVDLDVGDRWGECTRDTAVDGLGVALLTGVLHVSWTVKKNRFNRTCEVKSVLCPHRSTVKSSSSRSCQGVGEVGLGGWLGEWFDGLFGVSGQGSGG